MIFVFVVVFICAFLFVLVYAKIFVLICVFSMPFPMQRLHSPSPVHLGSCVLARRHMDCVNLCLFVCAHLSIVLCSSVHVYIYIYVHTGEPAPVICDSRPLFFAFEN